MTSLQNETRAPQEIEQQAQAWLTHDAAAFRCPEVFAAFGAWIQADPRHRDAFIRLSLARRPAAVARARSSSEEIRPPERPMPVPSGATGGAIHELVLSLVADSVRNVAVFLLIGLAASAIDFLVQVLRETDFSPLVTTVLHGATLLIVVGDVLALVLLQMRSLLRARAAQRLRAPAREALSGG